MTGIELVGPSTECLQPQRELDPTCTPQRKRASVWQVRGAPCNLLLPLFSSPQNRRQWLGLGAAQSAPCSFPRPALTRRVPWRRSRTGTSPQASGSFRTVGAELSHSAYFSGSGACSSHSGGWPDSVGVAGCHPLCDWRASNHPTLCFSFHPRPPAPAIWNSHHPSRSVNGEVVSSPTKGTWLSLAAPGH